MVCQLMRYGHVRTICRLKSASDLLAGGVRGISMNFNCNTTSQVDLSLDVIPSHCNLHTKARTRQSLLGPSKANQIVQISIWLPPRSCRPTHHYLESRVIALSNSHSHIGSLATLEICSRPVSDAITAGRTKRFIKTESSLQ